MKKVILIALFLCLLYSCTEETYPKPRGYYRIDFPKSEYTIFSNSISPYSFEYNKLSSVNIGKESNWNNIFYEKFKSTVYLSYFPLKNNLSKYIEESRTLAYKHAVKADNIIEHRVINDSNKVYGLLYDIQGNAASSVQFYLTDSTQHFLRGSLYFNVPPNYDSLAPVINYVKQDINRMMKTLKWQ